jgi:hypothetical protein
VLDGHRRASGGIFDLRARAVDAAGNEAIVYGGGRTLREQPATQPAQPKPRPRARATMTVRVAKTRTRRMGAKHTRRWSRGLRKRTVAGGQPVLFEGRVGRPVPRHGKLVEVQAHFRGRWRTVSAVRARHGGRWRFRYAFGATSRRTGYRMRARVPVEAGYPFAPGVSRPVRVTVLPG